jgi:coproporphyrinogen III oxidase
LTTSAENARDRTEAWFEQLRERICAALEGLEDEAAAMGNRKPGRFERRSWTRADGGGGVMALMRGQVFEKVGVNVSTVWGEFSPEFAPSIPGAAEDRSFWASGISLVAHPLSPHVPPVHMNTRHIRTARAWFGGGADLNPIIPDRVDTEAFHARLAQACATYGPDAYPRFKAWADEYFKLPHRGETRGVGGIFFDYLETEFERDFAFTREVGEAFLDIFPAIVRRHMMRPWTTEERQVQLVRRGRYVEFNLLYDRGTQFGLRTGGNPEAILMSLPPVAAWP